jgi:ferric-dicitrate binding protein FerR (iron transport regulator)
MNNSRSLELMARKLSGEATAEEIRELDDLLLADADTSSAYRLLRQFWEEHDTASEFAVEEGLKKLLVQLDLPAATPVVGLAAGKKNTGILRRWPARIAAAVIILIAAGVIYFMQSAKTRTGLSTASLVEKRNSKGVKSTIVLTDGSKIWLNADSKISYPEVFSGNTREVQLNGEAFFEVAKNPAKPFIIHLAKGTVRVVGTSFNIRAYDNEETVETSVTTGKVAFIPKYQSGRRKQDTIFLTPDKKASYSFVKEEVTTSPTSAREDRAWTEGKLVFKDMTLEEIAIELERNFGKTVVFKDEASKTYRLTGSFENNTLDEIMYYLSRTKNFKYKITNSELLIAETAEELR